MKKYQEMCYVNTVYSLFIYVLLKKCDIEKTLFFLDEGIPEIIANNLDNKIYLNYNFKIKNQIKKYKCIYVVYNNLKKFLKKEKLENKIIYLQDHIRFSQFFLNNIEECYLLEDGLRNYDLKVLEKAKKEYKLSKKIKNIRDKILKKSKYRYIPYGLSKKIKKIYLTGIAEIPKIIKNKVEIVNLKEKWQQLSFEEQEETLKIFDLKNSDLIKWQKLENRILLITQPLSEDGIISEKEKIEIYKEIVEKNKSENIMIKSHPREKTDYRNIFPNIELIEGKFPLEILMLLGINFKEVITIFSTAALNFKGITNVNFIGTENNKHLKEKVGEIKKVYYKI